MNITDEIKKIDSASATAAAIFFLSLLGSSVLAIFYFDRDLFVSLDVVKLTLLAVSLSAPGVFIPFIITGITISILRHKGDIVDGQFGSASMWFHKHGFNNSVNMYLALFFCYLFSLSFLWFACFFAGSIVISSIAEMVHLIRLSWNPERYVPIKNT